MGRGTVPRRMAAVLLALVCVAALVLTVARGYGYQLLPPWPASGLVFTAADAPSSSPPFAERASGASTPIVSLEASSVEEEIERETQWLLACQMPDGAIAQTPLGDSVVPYFANLAAKTMVDIEPARARWYITWYIEHMNLPDRFGLAGTVYDYELGRDGLTPTYGYDSADSYAATFLSLASYYLEKTRDREFITANLESIDLAVSVLLKLQDKDGLVVVTPGSTTKYLMDNGESFRGLTDWADALISLGFPEKAAAYRDVAERIRKGIERILYDPARGVYAYSLSWLGKRFPKAGKWYPDAVSQLELITSGVLSPDDPRAAKIWEDFNAQFPSWNQGVKADGFPWAKIALTAAMMRDIGQASEFLTWVSEHFAQKDRPYPWYVLESASIIDLYRALNPDSTTSQPG